jgi:hypothetical protein
MFKSIVTQLGLNSRAQQRLVARGAFAKRDAGQAEKFPDHFPRAGVVIHDHQFHMGLICTQKRQRVIVAATYFEVGNHRYFSRWRSGCFELTDGGLGRQ